MYDSDTLSDASPVTTAASVARLASSLLLQAPDGLLRAQLIQAGYIPSSVSLTELRQSYYDHLCIPQSGKFLPPYAHVFRARYQHNGVWHFPAARHNGAEDVQTAYRETGFLPTQLNSDSLWRSAAIPADHLGIMLAFTACGLNKLQSTASPADGQVTFLQNFVDTQLMDWTVDYCQLLTQSSKGSYLPAVADTVTEALERTRESLSF